MSNDVNLGYDPSSLQGPLDRSRVVAFERYLSDSGQPITFDPAYLDHLARFHGGVPKKRCVRTRQGTELAIGRFLNFVDHKQEKVMGWYSVTVTWTQIEDRLNEFMIPFAALAGGDFLCFDHEKEGRPRVIAWFHEDSTADNPATEEVAENFDDLLTKLYECEE